MLPQLRDLVLEGLERADRPGFGLWAALVIDPIGEQVQFRKADAEEWIHPDPAYYSVSSNGTIDRFADGAWAVVVVIDPSGIVRAVVDLAHDMPPGETEGTDGAEPAAELVGELRAEVRRALDQPAP